MAFCDLLRMTVLLAAGAATVLAAVTVIVVGTTGDTLTLSSPRLVDHRARRRA